MRATRSRGSPSTARATERLPAGDRRRADRRLQAPGPTEASASRCCQANGTFCSGGDQKARGAIGYGDRPGIGLDVAGLHGVIRSMPKPVIAMVDGYAIGGGTCCTSCATSRSRRTARSSARSVPRMGSVDPASERPTSRASSARRRRARSGSCAASTEPRRRSRWAWSTRSCRRRTCRPRSRSGAPSSTRYPTAIKIAKQSFNADTDQLHGTTGARLHRARDVLRQPEGEEGRKAFEEKRKPDFAKFRR